MSQHDDRYARHDLPSNTAEFRAAPDASASTAEFKAFAAGQEVKDEQRGGGPAAWPEQPWGGRAPSGRSGRIVVLVMALVLIALIFAGFFLFG
jgi:hypothetical protein